jgi:uncharacterized Zn finger protein
VVKMSKYYEAYCSYCSGHPPKIRNFIEDTTTITCGNCGQIHKIVDCEGDPKEKILELVKVGRI